MKLKIWRQEHGMKSCKKCGIESGLWNGLKLMEWVQNKGKVATYSVMC